MSTLTVTVTRCPEDDSPPRPVTEPCPVCGGMVPGQAEPVDRLPQPEPERVEPERVELVSGRPSRVDPRLPGTSAILAAGLAKAEI